MNLCPHRFAAGLGWSLGVALCWSALVAPALAQAPLQGPDQPLDPQPPPDLARLQQENAALRAELARLQEALAQARAGMPDLSMRERQLSERLEALRASLPAPEGGSLTPAAARARAAEDARQLERLRESATGIDNPALWRELRAAENALHHSQFLLARADNARTVYRTRPGDSLAAISAWFFGDPEQWTRLFDANRHVLPEAGQVPPGVTLVVP